MKLINLCFFEINLRVKLFQKKMPIFYMLLNNNLDVIPKFKEKYDVFYISKNKYFYLMKSLSKNKKEKLIIEFFFDTIDRSFQNKLKKIKC